MYSHRHRLGNLWARAGFALAPCTLPLGSPVAAQDDSSKGAIAPLIAQRSMNIVLSTSDIVEVKKFYGEILALKPMTPLHLPGGLEMTRYQVGTSEIKFLIPADSVPRQTGGVREANGIRLLTFFFSGEAALSARFAEHGRPAPEFSAPTDSSHRVAFVDDPDGNRIELVVLAQGADEAMLDRVDIGLTVADVEKSRAFYGEFLGLEELDPVDVPALEGKMYSYRHGTTKVKFWSFGPGLPNHSGLWQDANGIRYIQYIVSDLDAVDAYARAKEANIHTPIFNLGRMARIMFIADPDGIINEFVGGPSRR